MSDDLKPCPFCGFTAALCTTDRSDPVYWAECISCNAEASPSTDKTEAIAAWNTRAALPAVTALTSNPVDDSQTADPVVNEWNAAIEAAADKFEWWEVGSRQRILALKR